MLRLRRCFDHHGHGGTKNRYCHLQVYIVTGPRLSVEVLRQSLVPGRARVMHSACTSMHRIKAKGGARLDFRLAGCDITSNHEWQVIEGSAMPTILGVRFWAKHKGQLDFKDRVIRMTVNGVSVIIPFTIGDEGTMNRARWSRRKWRYMQSRTRWYILDMAMWWPQSQR